MKEPYTFKYLFLLCFFLIFSGVLSAQFSNVTYEYSCPCEVTVTYDLSTTDVATNGNVELYYSADTTKGWTLAKTFTGKTAGTNIVDIWDCKAAPVKYGVVYFKLELVCTCRPSGGASVVINGVTWATRNVNTPGTFAANLTDPGMFYQWDRNIGWNNIDDPIISTTSSPAGSTWNTTNSSSTSWRSTTDPSPVGFRVPTQVEQNKLFDPVAVTNAWVTVNGVTGHCCTDKINKNTIFLPAAGGRDSAAGKLFNVGTYGSYWNSTRYDAANGYHEYFNSSYGGQVGDYKSYGFSVRSVAK